MMNRRVLYYDNKKVIIPLKDGMIHGTVEIKKKDSVDKLNFSEGKLTGENSHQGYEFSDDKLKINEKLIDPEGNGNSYLLLESNELVTLDLSSFEITRKKIEFPKDSWYSDSVRIMKFKDGKLDIQAKFCQIIEGEKRRFMFKDDIIVACGNWKVVDGFCEELKMKFAFDPVNMYVKYEIMKYSYNGKYEDEEKTIFFKNGKVSISSTTSWWSMKQDNCYFRIDDNVITMVTKGDPSNKISIVNEDGSCPELKKKFTLDTTNWEVKIEDLKNKYPYNGVYEDETKWISFVNGEVSMKNYGMFSMRQIIDNNNWYFRIEGNIIEQAGTDCSGMCQVSPDGTCLKLKKKFTLDTTNWEVKIEDLPSKYPIDGEYSGEDRWINFKDGKISMSGCAHFSFRKDIDGKRWYFEIDDNKILEAGNNCYINHLGMKQVQEDGSCPELKKKFTLDLDDFQMKIEDLPEVQKPKIEESKKELVIKEITQDGYILYHSVDSILTKKEFYTRDKLMKIEFSYPPSVPSPPE